MLTCCQCWVDAKYVGIRLWLHYFWIFVAEFGTVFVYGSLYLGLMGRLRSNYYSVEEAHHAKQAAWLMALYPAVYVACTLPLASARMMSLAGEAPSFTRLCVAGAMITSNGWLDVLVYSLTRRISLLGGEPPGEDCGIETFTLPFFAGGKDPRFGTITTIEATGPGAVSAHEPKGSVFKIHEAHDSQDSTDRSRCASQQSTYGSMVGLWDARGSGGKNGVHTETTVEIMSEPLEQHEMQALARGNYQMNMSQISERPSSGTKHDEPLYFRTTPPGYG